MTHLRAKKKKGYDQTNYGDPAEMSFLEQRLMNVGSLPFCFVIDYIHYNMHKICLLLAFCVEPMMLTM